MKTHTIHNQSGQILIVAILISTVLLTVGLSLISLTSQDTKVTKITESSSKARAAAEAGIEAALNDPSATSINLGVLLADESIGGEAVVEEEVAQSFVSPLISKDSQYTFYLSGYDPATQSISETPLVDDIIINMSQPTAAEYCETDQRFAVELTFISVTSGVVQRYLIDECTLVNGTVDEYEFEDVIPSASISPDPHLLVARIIAPSNNFEGARLEIVNASPGGTWPAQGRTIVSTATADGGDVTKRIQLFQSFPQFPAEFFVTQM